MRLTRSNMSTFLSTFSYLLVVNDASPACCVYSMYTCHVNASDHGISYKNVSSVNALPNLNDDLASADGVLSRVPPRYSY